MFISGIFRSVFRRSCGIRLLAVLVAVICVSLPPLDLFRSRTVPAVPGESGVAPSGLSCHYRTDFAPLLSHLEALTSPVQLFPPAALDGWLSPADREWRDPLGVALVDGRCGGGGQPEVATTVWRGSSQVACGQLIVNDFVNNLLRKIALGLKKFFHAIGLGTLLKTNAAQMGQAAAHHKENLIQAAARHVQTVTMKLNDMMAHVKKGVYIFRSLTTARGIYNLFMEHLKLTEDAKRIIADVYDLYRTAMGLHEQVANAFELAYQFNRFFKDFRSWYRDATPDGLIDMLNNFVYTSGAMSEHRQREIIRGLIAVYPDFRKDYELYLSHAGQALEQQKIYEQLLAKIEEHKAALKRDRENPNSVIGKPADQVATTDPNNNTSPTPIPPQGSPDRQNAANTNQYTELAQKAWKNQRDHETATLEAAGRLANMLNALEEELTRMLETAENGDLLEKELRDYFENRNNSVDMLKLYFSLIFMDSGRTPAGSPPGTTGG